MYHNTLIVDEVKCTQAAVYDNKLMGDGLKCSVMFTEVG